MAAMAFHNQHSNSLCINDFLYLSFHLIIL